MSQTLLMNKMWAEPKQSVDETKWFSFLWHMSFVNFVLLNRNYFYNLKFQSLETDSTGVNMWKAYTVIAKKPVQTALKLSRYFKT